MNKDIEMYEISKHDLRALLHWANYGVSKAYSGSYFDIRGIIQKHAKAIKHKLGMLYDFIA